MTETIKTIDGKKWIEYDEEKANSKKTLFNSLLLMLMFIAIVGLFIAILTIVQSKDFLTTDPIGYLIDKNDIISLTCYDNTGKVWISNAEKEASKDVRVNYLEGLG